MYLYIHINRDINMYTVVNWRRNSWHDSGSHQIYTQIVFIRVAFDKHRVKEKKSRVKIRLILTRSGCLSRLPTSKRRSVELENENSPRVTAALDYKITAVKCWWRHNVQTICALKNSIVIKTVFTSWRILQKKTLIIYRQKYTSKCLPFMNIGMTHLMW